MEASDAPRSASNPRDMHPSELVLKNRFLLFLRDQDGATAIEYGLIAGLISVVVITAVTTVGTKLSAGFSAVAVNL
jgi:pilus assembly protein Flp/PilA